MSAKGLSGATIIIRPATSAGFVANANTIIGNTVLYGATAGTPVRRRTSGRALCSS